MGDRPIPTPQDAAPDVAGPRPAADLPSLALAAYFVGLIVLVGVLLVLPALL
jgi:hypothetical protein